MTNRAPAPADSTSVSTPCAFWTSTGAALGFLAVAVGAFGAHGLKALLETNGTLAVYETGVLYHLVHAPVVFALGLRGSRGARVGAAWMTAGIVVFSGSLYILAVSNVRWLGAITPFGGVALLVGWGWLAWKGSRRAL